MDILEKKFKTKQFFKTIFREIDFKEELIRTVAINESIIETKFFNNIDNLINYCIGENNKNVFFQLATLDSKNSKNGKTENLKYRYCIALDLDKKILGENLSVKDIVSKFKELKIYCHCLVDTGNGYHAYILINKNSNMEMVKEVQEALCTKFKADKNAIKLTQVLRVPFSYNLKDEKKLVRIVNISDRNDKKFRAYDLEFLYKKNCFGLKKDIKENKFLDNMPICLKNYLKNGSIEGERYKNLCNIVVYLKLKGKDLKYIKNIAQKWALKSNYNEMLDYKVENIFLNKKNTELNCKGCEFIKKCHEKILSDFSYRDDEIFLTVSETNQRYLKYTKRRGAKEMKANDLLIYCILLNHDYGISKKEIEKEITYVKKKKVKNIPFGDKTLRLTLKSLMKNGFITVKKGVARKGEPDLYFLKKSRAKEELKYSISFAAAYECIKGNISTEELRLYNYMRYIHHVKVREGSTYLRGNLLQINQTELAKDLGVTQGRISQMLENLLEEKIIGLWYREKSSKNSFSYNIYKLNY